MQCLRLFYIFKQNVLRNEMLSLNEHMIFLTITLIHYCSVFNANILTLLTTRLQKQMARNANLALMIRYVVLLWLGLT